jgi:hypothetical protein
VRVASAPDANTFTYTFAGGTSPATGTITATPRTYWATNPGADIPSPITVGAAALNGTYHLTVSDITGGSAVAEVARGTGNTGTGAVTIGTISIAGGNAIFGETLRLVCTATASNAGTFTAYREDGTSLGTITVGAGAVTLQVGGQNAIQITIADGTPDWALNDRVDVRIVDLGKNRYVLTAPDGTVVGYPVGATAFTSTHLSFTVPDTTVAVSQLTADLGITIEHGLARGQITALLSNPMSGPVFSNSVEV